MGTCCLAPIMYSDAIYFRLSLQHVGNQLPALRAVCGIRASQRKSRATLILSSFNDRGLAGRQDWQGGLAGWQGGLAGWQGVLAGWQGELAGWQIGLAGWQRGLAGWQGGLADCPAGRESWLAGKLAGRALSLMNTDAGAAVCAHAFDATVVAMIAKAASSTRMNSSRYLFYSAAYDRAGGRSIQVPIVPLPLAPRPGRLTSPRRRSQKVFQ